MNRIFPNFCHFTIILFLSVISFSTTGSLSVLTKGNPRVYELSKNESVYKVENKKKVRLEMNKADLLFEGADLKKGRFFFVNHPTFKSLSLNSSQIKSDDGTFSCQGEWEKQDGSKEEVNYSMHLEPIKDGFKLKTSPKNSGIEIIATVKKK